MRSGRCHQRYHELLRDPLICEARWPLQHFKDGPCAIHAVAPRLPDPGDDARRLEPVDGSLSCRKRHAQPFGQTADRPIRVFREEVESPLGKPGPAAGQPLLPNGDQVVDTRIRSTASSHWKTTPLRK